MSEEKVMKIKVGDYLNGYKIVAIQPDPFVKGQIDLLTDEIEMDCFGDRSQVMFFVRDRQSSRIYREAFDKNFYYFYKWLKEESQIKYRDCGHRQNVINEILQKFEEIMKG